MGEEAKIGDEHPQRDAGHHPSWGIRASVRIIQARPVVLA
jgi:hypothetical protein